jgi:hypothetical protein
MPRLRHQRLDLAHCSTPLSNHEHIPSLHFCTATAYSLEDCAENSCIHSPPIICLYPTYRLFISLTSVFMSTFKHTFGTLHCIGEAIPTNMRQE